MKIIDEGESVSFRIRRILADFSANSRVVRFFAPGKKVSKGLEFPGIVQFILIIIILEIFLTMSY